MTDKQHQDLAEISKYIEVLLHASEAPLTANVLQKHLSLSTKAVSYTHLTLPTKRIV